MLDWDEDHLGPEPWQPAKDREPPEMDHAAGWKPSAYSRAMGLLILKRIHEGETVKQVAADPKMPSYATIYRWTHVVAEFGEAWRDLRAERAWQRRRDAVEKATWRPYWLAHRRRMAGKPPRDWRHGRPSGYSWERAADLLVEIMMGASLNQALKQPGAPSAKQVYRWLRTEPGFREDYIKACREREIELTGEMVNIAMAAAPGDWRKTKRQVEALEGRLRRMRPRTWGW